MVDKSYASRILGLSASFLLLGAAGCQLIPDKGLSVPASQAVHKGFNFGPRIRYGAYPSSIVGTPWLGPEMGTHGYYFRLSEKNGIAYTCRGGHIDTMHLRIAADWTAYLAGKAYHHIMEGDPSFSYKLLVDRSRNYVYLTYPDDWEGLPEQRRREIAREVSLTLAPHLTFTMVTWHEILTWYGFKCIGLPAEFPSAFSWEDSYSNLLGTILAVRALRHTEHPFNEAMAMEIEKEMERLGVQPASVSKRVSESVRGDWYDGHFSMLVDMRMRNFDIGLGDGEVTPTLIPDVCECPDAEPVSYPVPTLDELSDHGFSAHVEIEPHEWEKDKILRIVHDDKDAKRVKPAIHFEPIMAQIRREATAKYGPAFTYDADSATASE